MKTLPLTEAKAKLSALVDELAGLRSCRVGRLRIVYRLTGNRIIEIVAVGPRRTIYEETYRLLRRG